ncbi:MAG: hypothetical protein HOO99_05295 [Hyphomicrobiaceae bacterium]|nr:hypothetical protein [Hyphomicrobiaceae bacterium]
MTTPFKVLQIARVTVEARTPLSLASGSYDARFDTLLVRDANDLPALPGTSIAGVLRRVFESRFGAERTTSLFGLPGGTSDSVADGFEGFSPLGVLGACPCRRQSAYRDI